jgi:hypothetical protein
MYFDADDRPSPVASNFSLSAYPNPFNPSTSIEIELASPQSVTLSIVNILGQEVARLHDGRLNAGKQSFIWNGNAQSSGIYFAVARSDALVRTTKLLLLK